MKRRDFFKSTAAATAAIALPAAAAAVTAPDGSTAPPLDVEVTRVRVGTWRTDDLRKANQLAREAGQPEPQPDPPDDENNYWAEAIRIGNCHFYRVGETVVPVLELEYRDAISNPNLYYFSPALKLHYRIKRWREEPPELA